MLKKIDGRKEGAREEERGPGRREGRGQEVGVRRKEGGRREERRKKHRS